MSKVNWTKLALVSVGEKYTILRDAGYIMKDGIPSENGKSYYPARKGGGYEATGVPVKHAVQVERGCPAYYATVAVLPL